MSHRLKRIFASVLSAVLSFFAGLGVYSALPGDDALAQLKKPATAKKPKPKLRRKAAVEKPAPTPEQKPRPRIEDNCPTCGMG